MLRRLAKPDWSFIRSNSLLSVGLAVARLLGLVFWLILARLFEKADTGQVRYVITLAELLAIGTMPFTQHVLTWFISRHRGEPEYLRQVMSNGWLILLGIVAATLVLASVVLAVLGRFDPTVLVVFLGLTVFYAYFGLARGHLAQGKLLAAFIGSNFLQILAVSVAVVTLGTGSTTPILLIYGASYLFPVLILQAIYPLPLHFSLKWPDMAVVRTLLAFAAPIWLAHTLYTLYMAADILILEYYAGKAAVGVYAVTRTLTSAFQLIPWAVEIMLMPRIAASGPAEQTRLIRNALLMILATDICVLICYLLGYRWFIETMVGSAYFAGMDFALVMAVGAILFGLYGITSSILVGRNRPMIDAVGRLVVLVVAVACALVLVPANDALGISNWLGMRTTGLNGIALATLVGAIVGLAFNVAALVRQPTAAEPI